MRSSKNYKALLLLLLLIFLFNSSLAHANNQEVTIGAGGSSNSGNNKNSMFDVKLENGKPIVDGLGSQESNQKNVIGSFKKLAGTIGAISLPIYAIILITLFVKISAEGNPNKREELIKHLIVVFIAIGLTALAGTIVAILFKFL